MLSSALEITVYGVRGSLPSACARTSEFGGNSTCFGLRQGARHLIVDAGTGIVALGRDLVAAGVHDVDLLLTHAHYDHLLGLPFFAPIHDPKATVRIWYGGDSVCPDGAALLDALLRDPFMPFTRRDLRAVLQFRALPRGGKVELWRGLHAVTGEVLHPGGCLGLRIESGSAAAAFVPDFEHDDGPMDQRLIAFLRGSDIAFLDCTYTPEEYESHRGFGHAHWRRCAEIANAAGLVRWGLFHHAMQRSDGELKDIEAAARAISPGAFAAREGAVLTI